MYSMPAKPSLLSATRALVASCASLAIMAANNAASSVPWGVHPMTFSHRPLLPLTKNKQRRPGGARVRFCPSLASALGDNEIETPEECCTVRQRKKPGARFVAKTAESFKLADLYWLESRVISHCHQSRVNNDNRTDPPSSRTSSPEWTAEIVGQLAFHRPTASHLLCWDYYTNGNHHDKGISPNDIHYTVDRDDRDRSNRLNPPLVSSTMEAALPFRPGRFQYTARIIAVGQTPRQLLDDIIEGDLTFGVTSWTLEYDTFEPLRNRMHPQHSFHPTMLLCAVSRTLPGEPLLASSVQSLERQGKHFASYVIIETPERLYLAQKLPCVAESALPGGSVLSRQRFGLTHAIADRFRSSWAGRPFQYSGAINSDAALVIVDILRDALQGKDAPETLRMLDPTCGSGTFLALALMAWGNESNARNVEVVGVDSNPKCASGTMRNLKHLFPKCTDENAQSFGDGVGRWTSNLHSDAAHPAAPSLRATIHAGDSVRLGSFVTGGKFDCAVANLPWNRNTFEFQTRNHHECASVGILEATAAALKPGSPLVVVSGGHRDDQGGRSNEGPGMPLNARECLERMGFLVLGEASIPPRGYKLPASGKKGDTPESVAKNGKVQRNSDCLITVAVAPEEI